MTPHSRIVWTNDEGGEDATHETLGQLDDLLAQLQACGPRRVRRHD